MSTPLLKNANTVANFNISLICYKWTPGACGARVELGSEAVVHCVRLDYQPHPVRSVCASQLQAEVTALCFHVGPQSSRLQAG